MQDRTLPLDPKEVAAPGALDDEALGRTGEEIRDDGVDGDAPAGDRDPRLAGRYEHRTQAAPACFEVELAGRRHLPDRAIGADGEHDRRVDLEVRARRSAQVGRRLAQVAQLDPALARQLREPRDVVQPHVQTILEIETVLDAALEQVLPVTRKPAALRDDADERGVRPVLHTLLDRGDDRDAVIAFSGT